MRLTELLTLMGHLSVGNDNVTPLERSIFLQYLNLAHLELHQATANFNQDLLIRESLANEEGSHTVALSRMPYILSRVYNVSHRKDLTQISLEEAIERDPRLGQAGVPEPGTPWAYFKQKNIVSFFPAPIGVISVVAWYIPQPSSFGEDTIERDIPYPTAYHPVLVDGALYYLFQEEGGFKNSQKENEAKARWEAGKSRLISYLYHSSGQTLSTFSNA